jgi:glycine/serine hydroxymethyltransferase
LSKLRSRLDALADRAVANNLWRQRRCFNLIPSEQTPSLVVKMFEIADPAGRYAEHRKHDGRDVYYYQGVDFIREVEGECRAALADYFDCANIELRPISGQMANEVVFKALLRLLARRRKQRGGRLRRVLNNDLGKGGHLSAQPMGALFNFVESDPASGQEAVTSFPVCPDNPYRTDVASLLDMLSSLRPDLVIFGKSMFLYPEPVRELCGFVAGWEERPLVLYDMAHVLGLYGAFQAPFQEGADIVTGSTHKTFFGPQRGVIAGNRDEAPALRGLWEQIENRAFPGSTSNHHLGTLLGLLAASYEMIAWRDAYQNQVLRNAKAFAVALARAGVDVEGDPNDSYTETHQVVCRVSRHGTGEQIAQRLERNDIIVNSQALPDDESFRTASGIRLGVAEMTRFGMQETDFEALAGLMADAVVRGRDVRADVERQRAAFSTMRYCLAPAEAAEIGARLLASILPNTSYAGHFADGLRDAAAALAEREAEQTP